MTLALDRAALRSQAMMSLLGLDAGGLVESGRLQPEDLRVIASVCGLCRFQEDCGRFMRKGPQERAPRYCAARVPFDELAN